MSYSAATYSTRSWPSHASSTTSSRYPDQTVSSPYPEALPRQGTARSMKQPLQKLSSTAKNSKKSISRSISEMPASKKQISDSAPASKAAVQTKPVELVVGDASKVTAIGTNLGP